MSSGLSKTPRSRSDADTSREGYVREERGKPENVNLCKLLLQNISHFIQADSDSIIGDYFLLTHKRLLTFLTEIGLNVIGIFISSGIRQQYNWTCYNNIKHQTMTINKIGYGATLLKMYISS